MHNQYQFTKFFRKCRLHNCNLHTHALQWSIPFVFHSCWSCILFAWWENHSLFQNKPFSIIILGTITDCNCMPLNALIVYARWAVFIFHRSKEKRISYTKLRYKFRVWREYKNHLCSFKQLSLFLQRWLKGRLSTRMKASTMQCLHCSANIIEAFHIKMIL